MTNDPLNQVVQPVSTLRNSRPTSGGGTRVCGLGATLLAGLGLTGCQGVLDPHGPIGGAERTILLNSLAIMLAIIVPTIIATLAFAWWFRASNTKARYRPDFAYSGRLELVIWSVPLLTIFFLGGITWVSSHQLDPGQPIASQTKALPIQVVSLDWKWLFIYPEQGVASVNQVVVPAGTPVAFTLTSASVLNSFFVPQLGSMIYTMNGMTTQLHLQTDEEGMFEGWSTHFSGDGFPGMHFMLHSVGEQGFKNWVGEARRASDALDKAHYMTLAKQSSDVPPALYRSVDPSLFQAIASQMIPPSPGPEIGMPTPDVSPRSGG